MQKIENTAYLPSIDAFVEAAATGSYKEAGANLGLNPTTVSRQIDDLAMWLGRPLVQRLCPLRLTNWGEDLLTDARRIRTLIDEGQFRPAIKKSRVHPDGSVTTEGVITDNDAGREIARLLLAHRAPAEPPAQRVDPRQIRVPTPPTNAQLLCQSGKRPAQ